MKRARVRFLVIYRIYPRGSNEAVVVGQISYKSPLYRTICTGLMQELNKSIVLLHEKQPDTHYLEIINITKM